MSNSAPIIDLKTYHCPLCGNEKSTQLYVVDEFSIVRCVDCSMVYVNPRLINEKVYTLYTDNYFHRALHGYENYELTAHLRIKTFKRWYKTIVPYCLREKGHALDIGCAAGYFLDVLKKDGWLAEGIELDKKIYASLVQRGYDVYDQPLEKFIAPHRYELITLFDVVEHLPHVQSDFAKLHAMLADDGILALVTPNFDSLQRKIFGKRWFQFKPMEHIYYFSPQTLKKIADQNDFAVLEKKSTGQYADIDFIMDRLRKYGFLPLKTMLRSNIVSGLSWYADTGSMLVILQKK